MIERVGGTALRVYAAHRRRALEGVARDAARVQEAALLDLVNAAVGDWLVETRARRALLGERS